MERLSTGIPKLDKLIEGGLRLGTVNLVSGESGTGKSTFATHFLKAGVDAGEAGLYVSVEERKEKFYENMSVFGFDMAAMEADGKLVFHKATVSEIRGLLDQGVVSFEEYFKTYEIKRIVIDSVTALMLSYSAETSQRNALMTLFDMLERWGATIMVTSEIQDDQSRFGIEYLVDSIIRLYYRKLAQERVRTLEVVKMRGTDHTHQEIVYRLGKKGFELFPGEKILA
jgi:circadian clock protein KaiC